MSTAPGPTPDSPKPLLSAGSTREEATANIIEHLEPLIARATQNYRNHINSGLSTQQALTRVITEAFLDGMQQGAFSAEATVMGHIKAQHTQRTTGAQHPKQP